MRALLTWLLDADPDSFAADAELGLRFNQSIEGWLVFVLAVAVVCFGIWIYRTDGKKTATAPFRFLLGLLRVFLLVLALLFLAEPVIVATRTETKPSTVLVLIDDSYSMSLGFSYAEDDLRKQVQAALGPGYKVTFKSETGKELTLPIEKLEPAQYGQLTRMKVACQALRKGQPSFLAELQKQHLVKIYAFSENLTTATEDRKPLSLAEGQDPEPRGKETRLGDCLRQALKDLRGLPVAGVVLVSDGRQNAGEDAVSVVARQFKVQRIPLFTVGVGDPGEPKDLELAVDGPELILPDDPTEVLAYVRQKGYDSLGSLKLEMRKSDGTVVASEEVKLGKSGEKVPWPMKFRERQPGKYEFHITLPRQPGELREDNNEASYKFEVVDKKVKVLLVEGQDLPRWEYRYLKNALVRDHTTEADVLLGTADGNFIYEGSAGKEPIQGFPTRKKEINEYDVIILGDVNPALFTSDQIKLLADFVREGGGFILIAGERYAPAAYTSGPLAEMLPVVPQRAAYETPAEGFQENWPLELTAEGRKQAWTQLVPDSYQNREVWDSLPRLYWYFPVKKTKELAVTVAVHPYDKDETGKKMPLLVTMPYGSGRTLYVGTDDLWRWRKGVGDRYHYRFYNQAIRFLSASKRLGGQKRFRLGVDKRSYAIGDRAVLTAWVKDENFEPLKGDRLTVYLQDPKGKTITQELPRKGEFPGTFEGEFIPGLKGDYQIWLVDQQQPGVRQAESPFKVDVPQLELENPRMNEELLKAIAGAGAEGGAYFSIDRVQEIPKLIAPKEEKVPRESAYNLWDKRMAWAAFALFTLAITLEWLLRKRGRMI